MGKPVFLLVLGATLLALAAALLLPGGRPPEKPVNLPWQIEVTPDGLSRVFGITLGKSTLSELEQALQEEASVSLFSADQGKKVVEAYFNTVTLSGLKARMVATVDFTAEELQQLFDRGERISTLAMGKRKVTLSDTDLALARARPVVALTYLPRANLDEEAVLRRFGEPARRIAEVEGKLVHWLYPDKGLDVVISMEEKEVLQYVAPRNFQRLLEPLQVFID